MYLFPYFLQSSFEFGDEGERDDVTVGDKGFEGITIIITNQS